VTPTAAWVGGVGGGVEHRAHDRGVPAGGAQLAAERAHFADLARKGVADARAHWYDSGRGWWLDRLHDSRPYPLATIWSAVPLWEALNARALSPGSAEGAGLRGRPIAA